MKKRGQVPGVKYVVEAILGVLFTLGLIAILILIINPAIFFGKAECKNKAEWSNIKPLLEKFNKNQIIEDEITFYNEDCPLVSFYPGQTFYPEAFPGKGVEPKPQLCLCKMSAKECEPYRCFLFENIEIVTGPNNEQFSTRQYETYIAIRFLRQANKLIVSPVGQIKKKTTTGYKQDPKFQDLDQGVIKLLTITHKLPESIDVLPIVTIEPKEKAPQGEFPLVFSLKLGKIPGDISEIPSTQEFRETAEILDPNLVTKAHISINIERALIEGAETTKLFYLKDNIWKTTNLTCILEGDKYACATDLTEFAELFAVSTKIIVTPVAIPTGMENIWINYGHVIAQETSKHNIPPEYTLAQFQLESANNPYLISTAACVGLGQICSKSKFSPTRTKCCECEPEKEKCSPGREFGENYCKNEIAQGGSKDIRKNNLFLCSLENDDRFDPAKNINSSVDILSRKMSAYKSVKGVKISQEDLIKMGFGGYLGCITTKHVRSAMQPDGTVTYEAVLNQLSSKCQASTKKYIDIVTNKHLPKARAVIAKHPPVA